MKYWYKNCPRCNQGRLFIMQRHDDMKLYVHCEECEWAWDDPRRITEVSAGVLGIDFDSDYAEASVIENEGWSDFALNEDD